MYAAAQIDLRRITILQIAIYSPTFGSEYQRANRWFFEKNVVRGKMKKVESYPRILMWTLVLMMGTLAGGCGRDTIFGIGGIAPPPILDTIRPTVTLTVPANGASAVNNTRITATFSEDMAPATINSATSPGTFTVCANPCVTPVSGSVIYVVSSRTATFTPNSPLPTGPFDATITIAATDVAGNALAGNQAPLPAASNYVWSFTTNGTTDVVAPTVVSTNPADLSSGMCLQKVINATFSEAMDPATITTATITLQVSGPPLGPLLAGSVTYDANSKIGSLTLTNDLLPTTNYTATITTGAQDLAGNPLATNKVWTFTTGTQACQKPPALGAAQTIGNLGGTSGSTNSGLLTVVNADMTSTATATSSITGFHDSAMDVYTETPSNQGSVTGRIYTCAVSTTGPTSAAVNPTSCSIATAARHDAETAYNTLAGIPGGSCVIPCAPNLAAVTLFPGVYQAPSGSFLIQGGDLTLDAQGDPNAVWVFQMATTLTVGGPGVAFPQSVVLINGAQAKNVFWQVGSSATINAAGGGTMVGTILAFQAVSFSTVGPPVRPVLTFNGRAAGLNAAVTMTNTVINVPAP